MRSNAALSVRQSSRNKAGLSRSNDAALNLIIAIASALGLAIVLLREQIIPINFSYDGLKIQAIANQQVSGFGDSSYESVAWIYASLGLAREPLLASILGYGLFLSSVILVRRKLPQTKGLVSLAVLYSSSIILGAAYLGFYSKDVFVAPMVLVLLALGFSKLSEFVLVVLMVAYASNFRSYWFLVLVIFLIFQRLNFLRYTRPRVFWLFTFTSLAISVGVYAVFHYDPDHFREMVNASRLGSSDATTAIPRFVNFEQPTSGTVNNLLTFWFLFAPLPLLQLGQVAYILIFIAIAAIWFITLRALEKWRHQSVIPRSVQISTYLLFAFVCVQAVFEPDFGSALRHLTPLTPLMLVIASSPLVFREDQGAHATK